jgi:thiamine biosynthesis lipoprotein
MLVRHAVLLWGFTLGWAAVLGAQSLERYLFVHRQMGTAFRIILYAEDMGQAEAAAAAAFARVDQLNKTFSDYHDDSELSRLAHFAGRDTFVPVGEDLWRVAVFARELSEYSQGAFDLTIGPLSRLWRRSFRHRDFPPLFMVEAARELVDYRRLILDVDKRAVALTRAGMRLDAGGIAKGYTVDEAMKILRAHGIRHALVDGGGDLLLAEAPPDSAGWKIGRRVLDAQGHVVDTIMLLANLAIATSGDTYRFLEWEGRRYSHLIDPRSGLGMTDERLVSVIAPSCTLADALASALSVVDPDEASALLERYPGVEALIIWPQNAECRRHGAFQH